MDNSKRQFSKHSIWQKKISFEKYLQGLNRTLLFSFKRGIEFLYIILIHLGLNLRGHNFELKVKDENF